MENTPYQRLELFWKAKGLKNTAAFAESVPGLTAAALSAMKKRGSLPSAPVMRYMQLAYPDINPDFILFGEGEMLRDGRTLTPAPTTQSIDSAEAAPVVAGEPHPDFTSGPGTIDASYVLVLREQIADLKADKTRLVEENKDLRTENKLLLKKSLTSLGAADFTNLPPMPAPNAIGFGAAAERAARAEEFDAYVQIRQEEGGVAELV